MNEIEIKVIGVEKKPLEDAILKEGGVKVFEGLLIVRHYDYPDGRLRNEQKLIRVRSVGDEVEFAYKGPKIKKGRCKVRPEIQTLVKDGEVVGEILKKMGLVETLYLEKKRTTYEFMGTHVDIDEYPGGVCYAEIEGDSEEAVYEVVDRLKLGDYEISCESAFGLFKRKWPEVELNGMRF